MSRAWIKERDLKEYFGKHKSDVPLLKDAKWNTAIEYADEALKMEVDERWTLIAELKPSDDEDDILFEEELSPTAEASNDTSNANKESPKSKSAIKDDKTGHKSDLKRKNSPKDGETKDRKKFKKLDFDSSDNESIGSDDEFKVGSSDEESEDSVVDEVINLDSDVESVNISDSSDSEPKPKKKSKSSKSKHKSKSKKRSDKSKSKKSAKKSRKAYISDESDEESEASVPLSSDSEADYKSKRSSKSSKKSKNHSNESHSKKSNKALDSDAMSVDSESELPKPKKGESSTPKSTPKNWLTERIKAQTPSEKKSLDIPRSSSNKLNKSVVSIAEESFRSVNVLSEQKGDKEWPHMTYEFLKPEKMKDKSGRFRLINGEPNPDYDGTTLTVPQSFLDNCTPALRQWWVFKSNNFDTILFFKMGKFYELFNMDAVIAVNELQIQYMRGECAHAGFPEKAYKRYADVLIQRNYKVARIEQTETPQMMEERVKQTKRSTKFDRVVNREMCRVSTIGTRMASVIDPDSLTDRNSFLLAITENVSLL